MARRFSDRADGFTLIELLVVVSIIALLISILLPSLSEARFAAKTSVCLSRHKQIATGCFAYAAENDGWFPYRDNRSGNHPHWWSGTGANSQDVHLIAEQYLIGRELNNATSGPPRNRRTPQELTCAVSPQWFEATWPRMMNGTPQYSSNINVYAGFDLAKRPAASLGIDPDEMPVRMNTNRSIRPMSGDYLVRFGPIGSDTGWSSPHTEHTIYHHVTPGGSRLPDDPVPFSFEDGSARVVWEYERTFDAGPSWHHYWAAPGQ